MEKKDSGQVIKNSLEVGKDIVERAEKITVQRLITEKDGSSNIRMRKFTLEPEGKMGLHKHDNTEHVQYVLKGVIKIIFNEVEKTVKEGDAVFIPENTPHSYENIGKTRAEFLCMIPTVDVHTEILE
ncbi:MAG: cupin domain-containing protein [Thermoplasmatota archaeon]